MIVGVATGIGVGSTPRQARENGFNVTFPIGAMTLPNIDAHDNGVMCISPRLGKTGIASEIIPLPDKVAV